MVTLKSLIPHLTSSRMSIEFKREKATPRAKPIDGVIPDRGHHIDVMIGVLSSS
jgi:hypothetical protein